MYEQLIQLIKDNLYTCAIGFAIYAFGFMANFCEGVALSSINDIKWDWKKFKDSIIRFIAFLVGVFLLICGLSALKPFIENTGIIVSEELIKGVNVTTIIAMAVVAAVKYYKDALVKLASVLGLSEKEKEEAAKIAENSKYEALNSLPVEALKSDKAYNKLVARNKKAAEAVK